jgi:serine/threonine protein kinase
MESVPGTDLKTMIKQRGRFSVDEAIPLVVQACAGIGYAHRAGLVHCDVKPQNMLVTPDQRLKVTDFGIARALATIRPDEKYEVVWGSPQYFSPEQAAGGAPSPSSDVYSLGVILYEMLAGELPFTSSDPSELARMHREVRPIPLRRLNPASSARARTDHSENSIQRTFSPLPFRRSIRAHPTVLQPASNAFRSQYPAGQSHRSNHACASAQCFNTAQPPRARTCPGSFSSRTARTGLLDIDWMTILAGVSGCHCCRRLDSILVIYLVQPDFKRRYSIRCSFV